MRKRRMFPAGLLGLAAVCALVQGCGGLAEQSGSRSGPRAGGLASPRSSGQVVGRFLVSVRPGEGTMTVEPAPESSGARVARRVYGAEDALKLTSTGVKWDTTTKLLSGDVRIVSTHPLALHDTRIVIEHVSNSGVTVRLDPTKGDSSLPENGRPFYFYGALPANTTSAARKWTFENPSGVNFSFVAYVWANAWLPSAGDGNTITGMSFPSRLLGWATGDQGKILATSDGGLTWSAQNVRAGVDFKDVFFVSTETGFACGSNETIVRTGNRGRAWRTLRTSTELGTGRLNSIFFLDGSRGWAVGDYGVVLITTNGGDSWQKVTAGKVTPGDVSFYAVRFASATTGWVVGDQGTILKSTDGGLTWTPQALPSGMSSLVQLVGAAFLNASTGMIVGSTGTLLRTTNGGATWAKAVELPLPAPNLFGIAFADASTGWAVGTQGAVLKTTNGGATWTRLNSGLTLNLGAIGVPRGQTSFACVGGPAGSLFITTNGGTSWSRPGNNSPTSNELNAMDWIDFQRGWMVGMKGTILRTVNGGQTWISTRWPGGENLNDVYFVTSSVGYTVGSTGLILKSTDGGATWTQQWSGYTGGIDLPKATFRGVRFPDLNVGWVCGSNGVLLKTTNGGGTWTNASFPATGITLEKMVWTDPMNGWIIYSGPSSGGGGIYRTSNGGNSWTFQFYAGEDDLYGIRMFGAESSFLGFAVGERGTIVRTTNGTSWSRVLIQPTTLRTALANTTFYAVDFSDPKNGWVVGDDGKVLRTADGGLTWTLIDAGTTRNLYDAFFWDVDLGWVAGTAGTIRKLNE